MTFPRGHGRDGVPRSTANRDGVPDGADASTSPRARDGAAPLTFGAGIHYCLGANLARAELQEALAFLAARVAAVELAGAPVFGAVNGIYGLDALPLRLTRA